MDRLPGWLVNIAFGLAVTLIFYGVLEGFSRWFETPNKYRPSDLTVYELVPGHHSGGTTINRHGLRGAEIAAEKVGRRILAVGGSTTWGHKLDDDETWPHRLQVALRAQWDEPIEVLNGGVSGWGLEQVERALVARHLDSLDPDLVVVYSGWNEPAMRWNEMARSFENRNASSEQKHWIFHSAFVRSLARRLERTSRHLGLSRPAEETSSPEPGERPSHVDSVRENFPPLLGSIARACNERGVALAVVLYPGLVDLVALPSDPFRQRFADRLLKHGSGDLEARIEEQQDRHEQTLEAISDAARQNGIRVLDVAARMRSDLTGAEIAQRERWTGYFRDHAHLTPEGNEAVARALAPLLIEMWTSRAGSDPLRDLGAGSLR